MLINKYLLNANKRHAFDNVLVIFVWYVETDGEHYRNSDDSQQNQKDLFE